MAEEQGRVMMASTFKQHCLAVLDQVSRTGVPVIVTKRGRPVARLVPVDTPEPVRPTMGSVTLLCDDDDGYFTTGARWDAEGPVG